MRPKHTKFRQVKKGPVKWPGNRRFRRWAKRHLPPLRGSDPVGVTMYSSTITRKPAKLPTVKDIVAMKAELEEITDPAGFQLPIWYCYTPSVERLEEFAKANHDDLVVTRTPLGLKIKGLPIPVKVCEFLTDVVFVNHRLIQYYTNPDWPKIDTDLLRPWQEGRPLAFRYHYQK